MIPVLKLLITRFQIASGGRQVLTGGHQIISCSPQISSDGREI